MNAAFTPAAPRPDDSRRVMIEAMILWLDRAVVPPDGTFPAAAARMALLRLSRAEMARIEQDDLGRVTLTILGITAPCASSEYAASEAWKRAARQRMDP